MRSSAAASRKGIVHIIDALVALAVVSAVVIAATGLIVSKLGTSHQAMPDPTGLDTYISARLTSGDWLPLIAGGRADIIREELEALFQASGQPAYVAVYIYAVNPVTSRVGYVASSDPGLYGSYATLRYFVPVGGYYGDVGYVLEVRVYWG